MNFKPFVAAAFLLVIVVAARADTYVIKSLASDQGNHLYGVDDAGTVVIQNDSSLCATTCYTVYGNGSSGPTTTAPNLAYDDGSPCTPAVPSYVVEHAVCNGGQIAWTGYPSGNISDTQVFYGPDPSADLLSKGGEGLLMLNAAGDVVWDDHFTDSFYEAIDVSRTPEPSSIALLGTGLLGFAGFAKRRFA